MRYLYALYATGTFALLFLAFFPLFLLCSCLGSRGKKVIFYLVKAWGYLWFFLLGIRVERIFIERPAHHTPYIVVANHHSYLDTAMIYRALPFPVRPLAKKEIASVPLFGFLYRQLAVLVDRDHAGSRAAGIRTLQKALSKGDSIFIFPEGGFNETDRPLAPFFNGAFRLALDTKTAILPVIFPDTVHRFHFSSFWKWSPGRCRAIFLPPVSVEHWDVTQVGELKARVTSMMETQLQKATTPAHYG